MDYGTIAKREKARRYAEERNRFLFNSFDLTFHGDNNNHHVSFDNGTYNCDCEFFVTHLRCAHTMAVEILFQGMVSDAVTGELTTSSRVAFANLSKNPATKLTRSPQKQAETQPVNMQQTEKLVDLPKPGTSKEKVETSNKEIQKFSIESDLSPNILQESLAPYLEALSDLQHIIDELREREPAPIRILEITTDD